jgi:hypothetical protein
MKNSIRVVKVAAITTLAGVSIAASAAGQTAVPSASEGLKENGLIAFDSDGDITVASGHLHVVHEDGSEADAIPGAVYVIEPGHDAWVVGEEPFVGFEFQSAEAYAKA